MPLKVLLSVLGKLMMVAARCSSKFKSQLTGDRVIQIASDDGVAYQFIFGRRTLVAKPGRADHPDVTVTFNRATQGARALADPHAVHKLVEAILEERARVEGNPALLLWFFGLTRFVVPIGRQKPLPQRLPASFILPDPNSTVADRITRLGPEERLDPAWANAVAAHKKMFMVRGSAGEPVPRW